MLVHFLIPLCYVYARALRALTRTLYIHTYKLTYTSIPYLNVHNYVHVYIYSYIYKYTYTYIHLHKLKILIITNIVNTKSKYEKIADRFDLIDLI